MDVTQLDLFGELEKPAAKCVSCGNKTTKRCKTYWCRQLCDKPLCENCEHEGALSTGHRKKTT